MRSEATALENFLETLPKKSFFQLLLENISTSAFRDSAQKILRTAPSLKSWRCGGCCRSQRPFNLSPLTLFGLFAVTFMLVCYFFEKRSAWFILAFAVGCILASIYGFLQCAWPFGVVEALWSLVAVRRWLEARKL